MAQEDTSLFKLWSSSLAFRVKLMANKAKPGKPTPRRQIWRMSPRTLAHTDPKKKETHLSGRHVEATFVLCVIGSLIQELEFGVTGTDLWGRLITK